MKDRRFTNVWCEIEGRWCGCVGGKKLSPEVKIWVKGTTEERQEGISTSICMRACVYVCEYTCVVVRVFECETERERKGLRICWQCRLPSHHYNIESPCIFINFNSQKVLSPSLTRAYTCVSTCMPAALSLSVAKMIPYILWLNPHHLPFVQLIQGLTNLPLKIWLSKYCFFNSLSFQLQSV